MDVTENKMKQVLADVARAIVDLPDDVSVDERLHNGTVILTLKVAPGDMGKVIGKNGKIARSIRTVVKAAANFENKKVIVDIG